ncbi:MAG TPA: proline dehydrogenase family protein [Thermoanaerobaculia bacterium]|nr:proline dehydrogenase family protein [Thermoanaerobaculia bacterium]HUM30512.1 proline dehydrogenase family protein [Thermoanaerobaculia bacterium]HXK68704.1 proline dehydrogenase family protein [Thermoanaerobaculia bacterium]
MILRAFFIALSRSNVLKKFFTHSKLAQRASKRFIAGLTIEDAIPAVKVLNENGITATMDFLGENVETEAEAKEAADEVIRILNAQAEAGIEGNVSIKLTQMGFDLGDEFCTSNIERIIARAKELKSFVRIDMEGSDCTQRTLDIFYNLRSRYDNVGIVIQSYLYRSEEDIRQIISRGGVVRLCKGAYREPKTVAFQKKSDSDANFVKLTKLLLDSGLYHGIATHDEKMIQATIDYVREKKIDVNTFEFQMLYGIRRDLQKKLVEDGYRMRVYVPYGHQWYPYFMRRLAERPANLIFLLKNIIRP